MVDMPDQPAVGTADEVIDQFKSEVVQQSRNCSTSDSYTCQLKFLLW